MKSVAERMKEFVTYHINGDGECNGVLLKAYADEHELNRQQRFDLAYFYSVTYCIPSALIIFYQKDEMLKEPYRWADKHIGRILFQSDRRYARLNGNFRQMLNYYREHLQNADDYIKKTSTGNKIVLDKALAETQGWYFFGRFGAFLFVETLCRLLGWEIENADTIEWKDGDTATSGLMNLFALDKSADYFDKTDKLPQNITQEKLDDLLHRTIAHIQAAGGVTSIAEVETSLCAYRKFYKGSRYNGYYLDRQLEELVHYEKVPGCGVIVRDLYRLRRKLFRPQYLGEIGGWKGVRKDCKTLYKRTGRMM